LLASGVTNLQADNHGIQIQYWLPIFSQDVQTDIALQIDIRMVNLLGALDLWRVVREILVDGEAEVEPSALIHSLVWIDC